MNFCLCPTFPAKRPYAPVLQHTYGCRGDAQARSMRGHVVCTLQAAQQVAEEQEADMRARATALLQADTPQAALENLMRNIFHSADTDGSGALSRKVWMLLVHAEILGAPCWHARGTCRLTTVCTAPLGGGSIAGCSSAHSLGHMAATDSGLRAWLAGVQGVPELRRGCGAQAVAAGRQHAAD